MIINHFKPKIKAAIIDMDGVLWKSDQAICDLSALFNKFLQNTIDVILATNNAMSTVQQYVGKLASLGIDLESRQIITSGMAAGYLIEQHFPNGGPVYIIGEQALIDTLKEYGFYQGDTNPIAVVGASDRTITYEKLKDASLLIRKGKPFYYTNPDKTYPTPEGLAPGAGSTLAFLEAASGKKAIIAGKPEPFLFQLAMKRLKTKPEETLVIGDRLETDILGGNRAGCKTALVLTGVATKEEGEKYTPKPDIIIEDIDHLFK